VLLVLNHSSNEVVNYSSEKNENRGKTLLRASRACQRGKIKPGAGPGYVVTVLTAKIASCHREGRRVVRGQGPAQVFDYRSCLTKRNWGAVPLERARACSRNAYRLALASRRTLRSRGRLRAYLGLGCCRLTAFAHSDLLMQLGITRPESD